jgi:hypothetical protein
MLQRHITYCICQPIVHIIYYLLSISTCKLFIIYYFTLNYLGHGFRCLIGKIMPSCYVITQLNRVQLEHRNKLHQPSDFFANCLQ